MTGSSVFKNSDAVEILEPNPPCFLSKVKSNHVLGGMFLIHLQHPQNVTYMF